MDTLGRSVTAAQFAYRYLDKQAFRRSLIEADEPRHTIDVLMALAELVDYRTGESHPRYPITLERLAHVARYSVSRVCDALAAACRWVKRFSMPPRRQKDGTIRQLPTDYKLLTFDEHSRGVHRAESTVAARHVEPTTLDVPWSLTVQGKLSTQDASPRHRPRAPRSWQLDPEANFTFIDGMDHDKLAPKLLDGAMLAAEGVDETLRHRTMVCLNALRERALDVALLACNLTLSSWDAVNCVKHWVVRCVTNPKQRVDSAEHAINILRKFFLEQQAWAHRLAAERIRERTRAKYQRPDDAQENATREASRQARAHIAIGHDKLDESALDDVDVDIFG